MYYNNHSSNNDNNNNGIIFHASGPKTEEGEEAQQKVQQQHQQLRATKIGLAECLKGGVIMDVMNAEQAKIAQKVGAVAVMALERIPALIRQDGGVARMSDPEMIQQIREAVTIPVMAKCRIGHFVEAQILEAVQVDFIDESEVLTPADNANHIWKHKFRVPFVCGARSLGEALRRIAEGATMIRTKGDAGSGNVVEAVTHVRAIQAEIRALTKMSEDELMSWARMNSAPTDLVFQTACEGHLPVPNFAAGGVATPADAALLMQLGAEAVFVGSGIFMSDNPAKRAAAIVQAVTHFDKPNVLAKVSRGLGTAMRGMDNNALEAGKTVGILALQGNVQQHIQILRKIDAEPVIVKDADQLADLDALILPGGESTTMGKFLDEDLALKNAILEFGTVQCKTILGTCAGLIILAKTVHGNVKNANGVNVLSLLDVQVQRNAYGTQTNSTFCAIRTANGQQFCASFIRAPSILAVGKNAKVLATFDGTDEPVAVQQNNIFGLCFHPENSDITYFHELFLQNVKK